MQNSFLKSLCLENITQRWFLNPKIRGRRGHWKCLIKKSFREFKVIFSQIYLLKWLHLDSNPQTVRERTLNNLAKLAKWLNCLASTYLCDAFDCMLLSCHVLFQSESALYGFALKRAQDMIRTYSQFTDLSSNFSVGAWKTIFIYFLCIMRSF